MKIKALFFGATAVAANGREIELALEENSTAAELIERLTAEHPNLNRHKLLFAVNEQYAPPTTVLNDGDELAIFTPVSGG
ncbi:MAG: MoaD/ThiS family protein [Pyrinomonadaceae bacterium]